MRHVTLLAAAVAVTIATPSAAQTAQAARDLLVGAAFVETSKPAALAKIGAAIAAADAAITRNPQDRDARLQRAIAIGYRGKLRRNRADVQVARRGFDAAAASAPADPEAQMAIAGWHLGAIIELGPLIARTGLGARKAQGLAALDRAVRGGGGRAIFPAFASFTRILIDPADVAGARALAEAAVRGRVARPEDRIMQRHAASLLPLLRAGNGKAAAVFAEGLMPFGRLSR